MLRNNMQAGDGDEELKTKVTLDACADELTGFFIDEEHARVLFDEMENSSVAAEQIADAIALGIAQRAVSAGRPWFSSSSYGVVTKMPVDDEYKVQEAVSDEALSRMDPVTMKEHFMRLKQKESRSTRASAWDLAPVAVDTGIAAIGALAAGQIASQVGGDKVREDTYGRLLTTQVETRTSDLRKWMLEETRRDKEHYKKMVDTLRSASASAVAQLSGEVQAMITIVDADIDSKLQYALDGNDILQLINMIRRRELVYSLMKPTTADISSASVTLSPEEKETMTKDLDGILRDYPEHRESLSNIISQIRWNSTASNPRRTMVYLTGPPGVGKTSFIERLAVALRQHYCKILAKDFTEECLYGHGQGYDSRYDVENEALLGMLGDAFRRADGRGIILNIDELGDVFDNNGRIGDGEKLSLLKKLLDPNTKTITLPGLRISLDISRVTIFATGNYSLRDPALLDRVTQLRFGGLRREQKAKVFYSTYRRALSELRRKTHFARFLNLKQISDKLISVMFAEAERFPGVRLIETEVPSILNRIFDNDTEPEYAVLLDFIRNAFAMHVISEEDKRTPDVEGDESCTLEVVPEPFLADNLGHFLSTKPPAELVKAFELAFSDQSIRLSQLQRKLTERLILVDQMIARNSQKQADADRVALQKFDERIESFLNLMIKLLVGFVFATFLVIVFFELRNIVVLRYAPSMSC